MKKKVNLYGGGAANLFVALELSKNKSLEVFLYEKNARLGRKFLVAGKGGFNLSHWQNTIDLLANYTCWKPLQRCLQKFEPKYIRNIFKDLGIETYIGSSNRIFPTKGTKPIEVLAAIVDRLEQNDVTIKYSHEYLGFEDNAVLLRFKDKVGRLEADYHVFGFGGGSWSVTGSNGLWRSCFQQAGIETNKFIQSNCGLEINWNNSFRDKYAGIPIKNISVSYGEKEVLGEFVISQYGIEGNAIYPISGLFSKDWDKGKADKLKLDFKPIWGIEKVKKRIEAIHGNISEKLRGIGLSKVVVQMIRDKLNKEEWMNIDLVCEYIKGFPLDVLRPRSIDESISTQGGIHTSELTENFELIKKPSCFCVGEMIDWDAPTGGYLLQACFSMGLAVGEYISSLESD